MFSKLFIFRNKLHQFYPLLIEEENSKGLISQRPNRVKVVRANERKTLIYPGSVKKATLLTPDLQGKLEVIITVEDPEPHGNEEWYSHEGEEFGLILEGIYEVTVDDQVYKLEEGDSICFPSHLPHKMRNLGNKQSKAIWVITPPVKWPKRYCTFKDMMVSREGVYISVFRDHFRNAPHGQEISFCLQRYFSCDNFR